MKNETVSRWTRGLWSGAAVCWVVVLFTVLVLSMAQGCSTARAMGRLVQAVGEDIEQTTDAVERGIVERN